MPEVTCQWCGNTFYKKPAEIRRTKNNFCSKRCTAQGRFDEKVFWSRGVRSSLGCLEWTGCVNTDGYGTIRMRGKAISAHRVAWILTHSEIPQGQQVLHRCDNPACFDPAHLFLGTHADNMADMLAKNRGGGKLSLAEIAKIKISNEDTSFLAEYYGVAERTIRYHRRRGSK